MDLLNNNRYIFHSISWKHWKTFTPSIHCELFYFYLRKYKYSNKFKVYYLPLKFKLKLILKKCILKIDHLEIFNKLYDRKRALIQIEKANFIKKNKKQMYERFHNYS